MQALIQADEKDVSVEEEYAAEIETFHHVESDQAIGGERWYHKMLSKRGIATIDYILFGLVAIAQIATVASEMELMRKHK